MKPSARSSGVFGRVGGLVALLSVYAVVSCGDSNSPGRSDNGGAGGGLGSAGSHGGSAGGSATGGKATGGNATGGITAGGGATGGDRGMGTGGGPSDAAPDVPQCPIISTACPNGPATDSNGCTVCLPAANGGSAGRGEGGSAGNTGAVGSGGIDGGTGSSIDGAGHGEAGGGEGQGGAARDASHSTGGTIGTSTKADAAGEGIPCGTATCGSGEYCCNPPCNMCAPLNSMCAMGCPTWGAL
ncbi:MAG TPA: hypothetical protein VF518_05635 [Polyangia bacterium]